MRLVLLFLFLVVACAPVAEEVMEEKEEIIEEVIEEIVEEVEEVVEEPETEEVNETVEEPAPSPPVNPNIIEVIEKKGHTIEVMDVTEEGDACLIKVDGVLYLIDENSEKDIDDITVEVDEVYKFRGIAASDDICEVSVR